MNATTVINSFNTIWNASITGVQSVAAGEYLASNYPAIVKFFKPLTAYGVESIGQTILGNETLTNILESAHSNINNLNGSALNEVLKTSSVHFNPEVIARGLIYLEPLVSFLLANPIMSGLVLLSVTKFVLCWTSLIEKMAKMISIVAIVAMGTGALAQILPSVQQFLIAHETISMILGSNPIESGFKLLVLGLVVLFGNKLITNITKLTSFIGIAAIVIGQLVQVLFLGQNSPDQLFLGFINVCLIYIFWP